MMARYGKNRRVDAPSAPRGVCRAAGLSIALAAAVSLLLTPSPAFACCPDYQPFGCFRTLNMTMTLPSTVAS